MNKEHFGACPVCGSLVNKVVNIHRAFVHLAERQNGRVPNASFIAICLNCGAVLHALGHTSVSCSDVPWQLHPKPELYAAWVVKLVPKAAP